MAALDEAQDQTTAEIVGWVAAQHATNPDRPRGRQVQVPIEKGSEVGTPPPESGPEPIQTSR